MILEPSVDNLLNKIDSKYAIVRASSSRARELHDNQNYMLDDYKSPKYVGRALEEIIEDKLSIEEYK
ncbi:DNA-directed RNA polymerase subunit omega [Alkalibacillus flavidus]|uniref:DNA-directed RNA polymerase subunit omega n=1 Tax=Alkalibacillus flavidus TaxID=546021 RepID=A0ABV2KSG6_9BACI